MREIKFRAWDKKDKKMRIVTRITFGLEPTGHPPIIVHLDDGKDPVTRSINDVILVEYTGLKDKNGKEIYEGNVFNFHPSKEWKGTEPDNPCVVFWSDDLAAWMFYVGKPEMSTLLPPPKSIEIIGNIYENPELLNEEKATLGNSR